MTTITFFNQLTVLGKRLAMVLTVLLIVGIGQAWAETKTYSYTFSAKQFSANSSKTLNTVSWTLAGDGGYWGYDGTKGQQFGSGSDPYKTLTLSTSGISGTITEIIINTSGASSVNASFTVSVGGTQWGSSTTLTTSATAYKFTGSNSGEIKFSYTQTSSKALYIKSISVTYETAASYTVTYNANGGSGTMSNSTGSSIKIKECTFTAPSGKEFDEWNTAANGSGTSYQVGDIVNKSLNLYAIWKELPKYTVTWNVNGEVYETTQVTEGSKPTFPATPSSCDATSNTFYGWATATWDGKIDNISEKTIYTSANNMPAVNGAVTYYAVFATKGAGGGTAFDGTSGGDFKIYALVEGEKKYLKGTGSKISPVDEAEATEYTFTKISDSVFSIKTGTTYLTYASSTNLGTSNSAYSWTISKGTKGSWRIASTNTTTRGIVYRAGTTNQFGGYATSNITTNGTEYYDVEIGGGSSVSYSGYITSCTAETTVTLNPNGGAINSNTGPQNIQTVNGTLTLPEPNKLYYQFKNWNTEKNGTGKSFIAGEHQNWDKTITSLYAQWIAKTYTISYKDQNGNDFTGDNEEDLPATHTYDQQTDLVDATKSDYNFLGWFTTSNCSGSAITQLGATAYTSNITLYAKWEKAKTATSLTWSAASYVATIDVDNDFPTLTISPNDLTGVTYSSSNTGVATIDANGNITLVAAGTTTITATFTETATHTGATASYTLTVHPSNCRWVETNIANINSEDEVIVAMVTPLGAYTLDHSKGTSAYPPAQIITINGNEATFLSSYHSNSIWKISGNATDGYILYPNGSTTTWLYCTATNYNVKVGTTTSNLFTIDDGYLKNKTHNVYVGVYNSSDWRHYPANTGNAIANQTLKFYKRECLDATNYWVTWDAGEGAWSDDSSKKLESYEVGATITTPADPTREGHVFKGWHNGTSIVTPLATMPASNLTYTAQWTPTYTITWLANGQSHHTQTAVEGTALEMPFAPTDGSYSCDDKVFVGWTETEINGTTNTKPADLFTSKSGALTANKTYYAVFASAEGEMTTDYQKITNINNLTDGNYVVAYSYDNGTQVVLKNTTKNTTQMNGTNLSLSSGIYANPDAAYIWQLTAQSDGSYYIYNSAANKYLSATTTALQLSDNPTKYNISYDSSNSRWTIVLKDNSTYYMHGYVNGSSYDFRVSTSGGGNKYRIYLYKNTSTVTYSDYVTSCVVIPKYNVTYNIGDGATGTAPTKTSKAEGTIFTLASADGISKEGYSFAGWLCDNDSKIYGASDEYTMPAADVTFTAQWNELPKYTVTFYNKGKEHSRVTQTVANAPVDCPTGLVACDGYTFAEWSTEQLDGVSAFTKIEGEYTPESDIILYAVYAESDVTTNGWVKVTDLSTITEGTYALLSNNDYAFNGTINDGHGQPTSAAFVFDGEGVATTTPTNICEIQLVASETGFKMYNEGLKKYLYATKAASGGLAWSDETSYWSWETSNWTYNNNNAVLRVYNNTFRTYGNNSGDAAVSFAKKNVTSFTTSPACDPMITMGSPEPVMVTSAKNIRVDAIQNITISATNLDQNADAAQVSIKLVSDNSAFKFKEVGANGDGQATPTWTGIANATFDKTLCITYTPTEAGQEETATLTVTAYRHNGSTEYATATMQVRGRSLPEQFVLVANTGDGWVALPNTLGTGSSASIPYPIAVEVDNDADPTSIPLAPSTTIYKAAARSSVNAIPTGLRFTTETGGYMQASTTETNIWLASNNSENMQSWTLNSTDFVDYSIRVNNAAEGHYLNYSNTQKKIGNYKSDNKLRILPVEGVCEQHAAPEDIEASSVRATSATIQWSAVSTATAGYEYRIGDTGEWTKIGNVTELEITGLNSLINYTIYVRASVEGAIINCSNEAEVSFTTVNCDDVPTDITYTSSSQSITVSWEAKAATSIVKLYSDKEGTTEVKSIESSSPCTLSDLEKYTTYYVQILAGGICPSQIIEVSTLIPNINIAEWMEDGILVDVNTDEDVSVIIENEESYGSGSGQVAEELFFSKYFEGSGSLKLLSIYNGTGKDVDLSTYRIDRGSNGNATNISKTYDLSQLGTIKNGQEIIFYSWPLNTSSEESVYTCSKSFLASKVNESGVDANPRWILCDANAHNGVEFETMDFSGDDPLLFYKGNTLIDVFGVSTAADRPSKKTQCSGRSEESWSANEVTNMDYGKTEADFEGGDVPEGVDLLNPTITAYTARVIMFRKNTVTSGRDAVTKNTTDFVTFADEWEARSVCKSGGDGDLTCAAYQELGTFNYSEYYTQYNTVGSEQVFPGEERKDGTVKITIDNLANYSCHNIKLNLKIGEDLKLTEITKVPILISDKQTTKITSSTFTTLKSTLGVIDPETKEKTDLTDEQLIEKCETCDIVVLANGKLTHAAEGIAQFNDLTIYPNGVFKNTSNFNVNRLLIHAQNDEVGCAIIENKGVTLTTNAIAHTKRIDAQYWYPFSLPYNCNIADITQANGESLGTYGVHWGIQYYDGKKRQASGTSAGIGQSSNFWTPIYDPTEQLNAYQGYMIALFDASVSSSTEMRTIYFPPVSAQMYTESGTDRKETTITSWNINLAAETRHHGWNFTGSPYISVFNPQATGLTEDRGLISEVLMKSGYYDPSTNEYLYDDNNVYVSVPSPNGAKYYDQYIASATSLKPFTAYFVQAIDPTSGNDETLILAYAKAGRDLPSSAPARAAATKQRVLVELNITAPDGQTDNTGIWVDERYTTDYEIAADLTKMYATGTRPQLYTLAANNEKLAYNALPDNAAAYIPLGLYAPVAGDYTLTLDERVSRIAGAESVELLYNNQLVANLLYQDYTITANKGTVNGYSLSIRRRAGVSTAVDNTTGNTITVIANDGYISLVGVPTDAQVSIYDMVGRLINTQYANGETVVNMPIVPQGVYNIVVANGNGYTTIKSVVK